ncbi:hypothetical protein [Actinacidiphila yanglinensis]|uniref:hypothetical protein n=1 Tax=Actinacidiphila yanglinensis TaxID=310779 RepID=UPI0011AFF1D9|nr:hypothetical protein [Actinacidiphila yanglinensis]
MTQHSREDQERALENALRLLERTIRFVRTSQDRSAERAAYAADLVRLAKGTASIAMRLDETA